VSSRFAETRFAETRFAEIRVRVGVFAIHRNLIRRNPIRWNPICRSVSKSEWKKIEFTKPVGDGRDGDNGTFGILSRGRPRRGDTVT